MGLHDNLAARAVAVGKTAADFKKGAQTNADATWICLIIAGVVWYFVDWRWALIPAAYAVWSAFKSVSASMVAARLEKTSDN